MAGSGDLAAVLTAMQFMLLIVSITAGFSIWFKPSKRTVPFASGLHVIGSILQLAVKAGISASLFEYSLNTISDMLAQRHLKKYPDEVDFSKWQTSIWILLIAHLFVVKFAETAYYGRESAANVVNGKFDVKRWYASGLYVSVVLLSTTLAVMFYMSSIWMAGSFHLYVAVVYGAWFFILNFCWSEKYIAVAEQVTAVNRGPHELGEKQM